MDNKIDDNVNKHQGILDSKDHYRVFRKMVNDFYNEEEVVKDAVLNIKPEIVQIVPRIFLFEADKKIKIEFKIGIGEHLYKIKNLPEFYDNMKSMNNFKYGSKLEFVHKEEAFEKDSLPILKFLMKYAEIIKYGNEASNGYTYFGKTMIDSYISLSNTGLDDFFETMKDREVLMATENVDKSIKFIEEDPNIKFTIKGRNAEEYLIKPNIDVFNYQVLEGKEYTYFLKGKKLYKCSDYFKTNILKMLDIFKNNFSQEIYFKRKDLQNFFSVVYPKVKNNIDIEELNAEEIEKYIPLDLYVKVYLDYDKRNFVVAEIKFCYGDVEFNPLEENQNIKVPRNIVQENEILNKLMKTGFMLDGRNARLILVNDDKIYNFLSNEIEEYMQKYEVLATENFKNKEIREPRMPSIGVRVENNLLSLNFETANFDKSELIEIMKKYKLKKKYHRLKDGRFIELEKNDTMDFIESIMTGMDVDFNEIEKGELRLPVYRSLYLDRLLENFKETIVVKDKNYKKMVDRISNRDINENINIPKGLKTNLRNYQKVGFEWLKILDRYGLGGILADDMGLGKTIQLLAVILSYVEENENPKPSIVVCPSSLTLNWYNEIEKFSEGLHTLVIHGNLEERQKQIKDIKNQNVVITSYDLLKRDIDLYKEENVEFKYLISDESQYIKNSNTQNAKAIKEIKAEIRYALTGTPIENSLSELWSIFDFVMPGYLFSYRKFRELFELPIIREEDSGTMNKLKMLIEPFILRRVKKEVLTELPEKVITVLNSEMDEEQEKIYMSYMKQAREEAESEIEINGLEKSQIKILALLMRLRQICCHPSLFIDNYAGESGKLNQCVEIVKEAVASNHRILLFSGYTSMFDIIEKELEKENIKYFKLTGSTKVGERIKLVEEFNTNSDIKVFLISLKAGGTGLNLTGADMVIHYDPWWNLSAENQATDRTYRIGQKRNVQVYKLITKNSIEEKIYELQKRKEKMIDNMLSTENVFLNKLSKDDIMELFS